jgi:predicted RNA-binding Zn ribbon-like protein
MAKQPAPLPGHWARHACLDLVNSRWQDHQGSGRAFDRLVSDTWRRAVLDRWDLTPDAPWEPDVEEQLESLRSLVRRLLETSARSQACAPEDLRTLNRVMQAAPTVRRLEETSTGYRLVERPRRRDWDWVAAELAASCARVMAECDPARLKFCANPDCTWMFYDDSRNRRRRWCDGGICGNLLKVRRFRARAVSTSVAPDEGEAILPPRGEVARQGRRGVAPTFARRSPGGTGW